MKFFQYPNPRNGRNETGFSDSIKITAVLFLFFPGMPTVVTLLNGGDWTFPFLLFLPIPGIWFLLCSLPDSIHALIQLLTKNPWWPYKNRASCVKAHKRLITELEDMGEPLLCYEKGHPYLRKKVKKGVYKYGSVGEDL